MKKKDMQSMVRLMLTPVLMVILGIVLVVRPDSASALVGKVLGWVLLVVGIGLLVESIAVKELTTSRILWLLLWACGWCAIPCVLRLLWAGSPGC